MSSRPRGLDRDGAHHLVPRVVQREHAHLGRRRRGLDQLDHAVEVVRFRAELQRRRRDASRGRRRDGVVAEVGVRADEVAQAARRRRHLDALAPHAAESTAVLVKFPPEFTEFINKIFMILLAFV